MKIAFYKGTKEENPKADWVDRSVSFWTESRFSHCELVFDLPKHSNESMFFSASGRDKKVRFKFFTPNPERWEYVDIDPFIRTRDLDKHRLYQRACAFVDDKYDYVGIFLTFVVPLGLQSADKWWCSEILGHILNIEFIDCYSPQELYLFAKKYEI
jgi:hypothetical protein